MKPTLQWPPALLVLTLVFSANLAITLATVPPWQNPDEPQHYMKAWLYTTHAGEFDPRWSDPAAEREVVSSMAEHGWWTHYREPTPEPVPASFADGPAHVVKSYFGPTPGGGTWYYQAMAALLGAGPFDTLLGRLYAMRWSSAIVALLMLPLVWWGTEGLAGRRAALVVTSMLVLHPQVAIVSTTASPDAWVNLAGALVWWQGARALAGGRYAFGWALAAALAGTLVRRMAAPLIPAALVLPFLARPRGGRVRGVGLRRLARSAAPALLVVCIGVLFARTQIVAAIEWASLDPLAAVRTSVRRVGDLPTFVAMFFRTFWISAGWLRHEAAAAIYVAIAGLCAVSAAGLVRLVTGNRARAGSGWNDADGGPGNGRGIVFAGIACGLQVAATFAFHFGVAQTGPQGRYLFPVLPAILTLIWVGWSAWLDADRQPLAAVALIGLMALLNVTAWSQVLLPAYA